MSQPNRFEAADLRCDACQSNTDFYGIMKTHDNGRWIKWDDYADLVRLQLETLEERNKAEAENERLRSASFVTAVPSEEYEKLKANYERLKADYERLVNLVSYLKEGKPFTKHEDDIRRGLRTK